MTPDADGHRYSFGAPSKGWPSFDKDGKKITEPEPTAEPDQEKDDDVGR